MIKYLLDFLKLLAPLTIISFVIQYFITSWLSEDILFYYSTLSIYLFHFFISLGIFTLLIVVKKNLPNYTGYAFLALSFLKMLASILFLLPLIMMKDVVKVPDIIAFFVPYFLILFVEVLSSVKLLNTENLEV